MPVLTAGFADVAVAHPHPAVLLGLEQHLLDQAAVVLLHQRALGQLAAVVLEPLGQVVTDGLELAETEDARTAARRHPPVEPGAGICAAEEAGQLRLELRDLVEQRTPSGALVYFRPDYSRRPCRQ